MNGWRFRWLVAIGLATASAVPAADPSGSQPFHPPIGPYAPLAAEDFAGTTSFAAGQRLVSTPYFYWYDVYSGEHLVNADGSDALTDHPPTLAGFSYKSASWHRTQLLDMQEAGIDLLLPVYWGEPSQRLEGRPISAQPWSFSGLPPLVAARDALVAEGRPVPRIGLFYDTSTLQYNAAGERIDLVTARGRQWFYETVRDFFSLIPPRHWAMIDGRPVIFLYAAAFAARHDQSCIDFLRTSFARDFGGRTPHVVREISWNVVTEDVYAWGGALGLRNPGVASLGPGYDHSAVPGREPLVVPRENGAFFERNWLAFLRRPSNLVMIETWNEFHEGTDIAHSREYGRQYLALNRRYADLFKAGYQPPPEPGSKANARLVEVHLGATNRTDGLIQFESADGLTTPAEVAGSAARVTAPNPHGSRYVYFRIDDAFKWAPTMEVLVIAEYRDQERGTLLLEFDGSDLAAPFQGAYTAAEPVTLSGTGTWRTRAWRIAGARFLNRQNGGADFRLGVGQAAIPFRRVQVAREGLQAIRFVPGDGCELRLLGIPGLLYDLEVSDDLAAWAPLVRLRPAAVDSRHLDLTTGPRALRWYRLRRPGTG